MLMPRSQSVTDKFLLLSENIPIETETDKKKKIFLLTKIYDAAPYSPNIKKLTELTETQIITAVRQLTELLMYFFQPNLEKTYDNYHIFIEYGNNLVKSCKYYLEHENRSTLEDPVFFPASTFSAVKIGLEKNIFQIINMSEKVTASHFASCNVQQCFPRANADLLRFVDHITLAPGIENLLMVFKRNFLKEFVFRNKQKGIGDRHNVYQEHFIASWYNTAATAIGLSPYPDLYAYTIPDNNSKLFRDRVVEEFKETPITNVLSSLTLQNPLPKLSLSGYSHRLICQSIPQAENYASSSFNLYRQNDNVFVLVKHPNGKNETLNLSELSQQQQNYISLSAITWPTDKDTFIDLDKDLVKFIAANCAHIWDNVSFDLDLIAHLVREIKGIDFDIKKGNPAHEDSRYGDFLLDAIINPNEEVVGYCYKDDAEDYYHAFLIQALVNRGFLQKEIFICEHQGMTWVYTGKQYLIEESAQQISGNYVAGKQYRVATTTEKMDLLNCNNLYYIGWLIIDHPHLLLPCFSKIKEQKKKNVIIAHFIDVLPEEQSIEYLAFVVQGRGNREFLTRRSKIFFIWR